MRRWPSLYLAISLVLLTASAEGGNIIPCRAKTWLQNVRTDDKRVCRQMDAGSTHVAVLAVAPWADYVSKLQPDFSLTSLEALAMAVPVTSTREEQMLSAITAGLKLAMPANDSGSAATTTNATTTNTNVTATQPPPSPIAGTSATPATSGKLDTHLPIDPLMQRLAALALFQEAKLLSMRIADTAVPENYTAYVVSLQITLMPNARREPYDAYTTITFLGAHSATGQIRVVPLLVTDSIEATRQSDVSQRILDLSLAASAMAGNTPVSASVRKQLNRLVNVQSTDFNSLMTVARLSENSIRVRLGAVRGNDRYFVVPRTHNITLVIMVPGKGLHRELTYIARTQLNDAIHGTPLSTGTSGMFGWRFENVIAEWARDYEVPREPGYYTELLTLAQTANYAAFRDHVVEEIFPDAACASRCKLTPLPRGVTECRCKESIIRYDESVRDAAVDRIWADAANYAAMGQYAKGVFALPEASSGKRRFYPKVAVTPIDDSARTLVTIRGSRFIDPGRVHARLRVVKNGGATYYLEPAAMKASGSDGVELQFPTLTPLATAASALGDGSALLLSYASSQYRWDQDPPFEQTPGLEAKEIAALNEGQEVEYPATIFFTAKPPTP
jgi:hypothetical protein